MQIGLLLFPGLTQLDLTGPFEVFSSMPGAEISLIWKTTEHVTSDGGMRILPSHSFGTAPKLDVICVPGGPGQIDLMSDAGTLAFLRRVAGECQWVTSVCTGSLVLAAAGLLTGYRATSHWASLDQLALFGAIPVPERVVRDRNRITGAGVTSGIDFALTVVAEILGQRAAEEIQLQIEYDPAPPFTAGSPASADPELLAVVKANIAPFIERRRKVSELAAEALHKA
ncbi:DJ-1/PfpI family protein [Phaeovulum sp. W22_SRMD_FR3]|uniref:DJ-1/PfpI family protein n=1 Tax=Phaeovulum sp. W22_SRMD_FR3 TaxID=3240274 RepID=UPI003F945E06